ncbi:MAG TPA: glycosyltransferase family 4 protein [Actinomycetota bacterium]|nr:glycosyltransferase family 4 protein [Actinomycetota bacterium]
MANHRLSTRVLIISHSYFMRDTRPRRHAQAFVDAGWEVDVLCARDEGEPKREQVAGVNVRRLPARRRRGSKGRYAFEYASFGAMALGAVSTMHLRRRYHIVYVFGIPNLIVRSTLVPHLVGTRIILDMRDPLPEFFQSRYGFPDDHRAVRALLLEERISCRYATHVLTVIDAMRDLFLRSVAPEKITVVRNAPDPRLFGQTGGLPARDPADRTLLYAGTVAERYGVDQIVRAVAKLKDAIPGIRARIVGDGDLVPRLRAIARESGIEDRVTFDGPVPLDAMPGIIASAWVGAQPHRADPLMRYSFSTKLLEWGSLGLPVITSATESVVREFSDDEMMLIPPGDLDSFCERILQADRDPEGLARRGERGRAAAARFDWNAERERLLSTVSGIQPRREAGRAGL